MYIKHYVRDFSDSLVWNNKDCLHRYSSCTGFAPASLLALTNVDSMGVEISEEEKMSLSIVSLPCGGCRSLQYNSHVLSGWRPPKGERF